MVDGWIGSVGSAVGTHQVSFTGSLGPRLRLPKYHHEFAYDPMSNSLSCASRKGKLRSRFLFVTLFY